MTVYTLTPKGRRTIADFLRERTDVLWSDAQVQDYVEQAELRMFDEPSPLSRAVYVEVPDYFTVSEQTEYIRLEPALFRRRTA